MMIPHHCILIDITDRVCSDIHTVVSYWSCTIQISEVKNCLNVLVQSKVPSYSAPIAASLQSSLCQLEENNNLQLLDTLPVFSVPNTVLCGIRTCSIFHNFLPHL
jgi:hypothetical protein